MLKNYHELKKRTTHLECSREKLKVLKEVFKKDINSNRMFDKIKSLNMLVEILEKRDCINEECLDPLNKIAFVLNDHQTLEFVSNKFENVSILKPNHDITRTPMVPYINESFKIQHNPKIRMEVYNYIADRIGDDWKELARLLEMREQQIDELSDQKICSKNKIFVVFNHLENSCDPNRWQTILLKALRDAKRGRLSDKVNNILDVRK